MSVTTHTLRYLHAVLVPSATANTSSPLGASAVPLQPAPTSHASPRLASISASRAAANGNGEDIKTAPTPAGGGGGEPAGDGDDIASNASASSNHDAGRQLDTDTRSKRVLQVLLDPGIAEEDKPDKLKQVLEEVTIGTEASHTNIDDIVLAILHRHREDTAPTGQTFSPPTPTPRQSGGTLSRSSSFRRNLTPTSASSLALKRAAAGIATPTRPISPSPLRSQSPSILVSRRDPGNGGEIHEQILHHSSASSTTSASSAPSSPFSSPRFLNATALEFRPNATAVEFRPGASAGNSSASMKPSASSNLSVKLPEPFRHSRSPIGTPATESSPTLWSFGNSPLGTPKFATGGMSASPSLTSLSNVGSYFPTSTPSTPGAGNYTSTAAPAIPSDPWSKSADTSAASSGSIPGTTHSASTASSESSYDDLNHFDPFAGSQSSADATSSSGKAQILSSESADEAEEWGIPSTVYGQGNQAGDGDQPRWNLYDDDEDEEDGLEFLQFKGGQLLPDRDELTLVEPPSQQRPVFEEGYQPQSTAQYSQLPQNYPSPPGAQASLTSNYPGIAATGLGASSSNYIMTPFDVLCSIFAGSDVSPADLEEALSKNGWDVDRSMEWIINNPRLPGAPQGAEQQIDNLNMLSLDSIDSQPGSGAVSPAFRRSPAPSMSGARPNIMTRESFQRNLAPGHRPASPRWAFGDGRPGTPGGRSDRSGDGYFLGAQPGGGGAPSTRLCKYYLQGNCLRSDCRFSHDLSKAVCKFWLRGHCLKGEGRCEFLHSVPPHLAADVAALRANALRVREHDKGRFMRPGFDDDGSRHFETGGGGGSRVEEDFPSLAAATASAHRQPGGLHKDPAATRWAGIVKTGRSVPVNSRPSLPRSPSSTSARGMGPGPRSAPFSQPRQSARLALRPPTLLPTIGTGLSVSRLYDQYRENFFEFGNARNKCLVKAADCWKSGDGAGAKRWSREAQDWNRQIAREGAVAANRIVEERKRQLKESVLSEARPGPADDSADRLYRGKDCGAGLGICLGVAAAGEALGPEGPRLSASERTEAALDLHGLHPDEAIDILEKFLLAVPREGELRGLVYVIVGQERHTGQADSARGTRKVRLADSVGQWLDSFAYAFWLANGIYAIDPYL